MWVLVSISAHLRIKIGALAGGSYHLHAWGMLRTLSYRLIVSKKYCSITRGSPHKTSHRQNINAIKMEQLGETVNFGDRTVALQRQACTVREL